MGKNEVILYCRACGEKTSMNAVSGQNQEKLAAIMRTHLRENPITCPFCLEFGRENKMEVVDE